MRGEGGGYRDSVTRSASPVERSPPACGDVPAGCARGAEEVRLWQCSCGRRSVGRKDREEHGMEPHGQRRILIVANRTVATPTLLEHVKRLAQERPSSFALLIPDAPSSDHTDWPMEHPLPLFERAARGPVEGLTGGEDPLEAIRLAVETGDYDA